mgnify:CR=1 FL=1
MSGNRSRSSAAPLVQTAVSLAIATGPGASACKVQLATVVRTWGSSPRPPGSLMVIRDDGQVAGSVSGGCIEDDLITRVKAGELASRLPPDQFARIKQYPEKRQYSFRAFEALEFACDYGLDFAYKTAIYDVMWTEGGDIGEIDTLLKAAERVGLDVDELETALAEGQYAERALEACNQARRIGITSTPTIFLGRTRINGWHYYEVLQSVLEKQGMKPKEAALQS